MCGGKDRSMEQPHGSVLVCLLQKGKWAIQTSQETSEVLLVRIQEDLQGLKMWAITFHISYFRLSEKNIPCIEDKTTANVFGKKKAFHFEMLQVVWIYMHTYINPYNI